VTCSSTLAIALAIAATAACRKDAPIEQRAPEVVPPSPKPDRIEESVPKGADEDPSDPYRRVDDPGIVIDSPTARYRELRDNSVSALLVEDGDIWLQLEDAGEEYRSEMLDEEARKFGNVLRREQRPDGFVMVRGPRDDDVESTMWVETRRGRIKCNSPVTSRSLVERTIESCWKAHRKK
jgi:hypothetical protein